MYNHANLEPVQSNYYNSVLCTKCRENHIMRKILLTNTLCYVRIADKLRG